MYVDMYKLHFYLWHHKTPFLTLIPFHREKYFNNSVWILIFFSSVYTHTKITYTEHTVLPLALSFCIFWPAFHFSVASFVNRLFSLTPSSCVKVYVVWVHGRSLQQSHFKATSPVFTLLQNLPVRRNKLLPTTVLLVSLLAPWWWGCFPDNMILTPDSLDQTSILRKLLESPRSAVLTLMFTLRYCLGWSLISCSY